MKSSDMIEILTAIDILEDLVKMLPQKQRLQAEHELIILLRYINSL